MIQINQIRVNLLDAYIKYIEELEVDKLENWALIIRTAREAGLKKQCFCEELSCVWSTVLRWEAGETAPGAFARRAIRQRLITMLLELRAKTKLQLKLENALIGKRLYPRVSRAQLSNPISAHHDTEEKSTSAG